MAIGSIASEFDLSRWYEVITLLSLDVCLPFHDLMGLVLREPRRLTETLRREIVNARKTSVLVPEGSSVVTPQAIIRAVAESLGDEASRHLVWWERHVFHDDPRDNLSLQKWTTVFQDCLREPGLWTGLGLPVAIREEARDRFRTACNIDENYRRQKEVDARPLSDWDLHMYALQLYNDNVYGEKGSIHAPDGPRLRIVRTVKDYQGYQFWNWMLRVLRPDERDRLWRGALEIVKEEEFALCAGITPSLVIGYMAMKDAEFPPDEGIPDVRPDDPEEQVLYLRRFRARYKQETAGLDQPQLMEMVRDALKLCPRLRIRDPRDVLRFLALSVLITPEQRKSQFLNTVIRTVLEAIDDWSATRRLDFIYKHLVGRPAPVREPDFGPWHPWYVDAPSPT